jgi:hypothetical protein
VKSWLKGWWYETIHLYLFDRETYEILKRINSQDFDWNEYVEVSPPSYWDWDDEAQEWRNVG